MVAPSRLSLAARPVTAPLCAMGLAVSTLAAASALPGAETAPQPATFCNPLDLPYRFVLQDNAIAKGASCREAADPTMVSHRGRFWLFASKSGGYWHSKDLVHWEFVAATGYPLEEYAPTVAVIGDKWLLVNSVGTAIYTSEDPATGRWTKVCAIDPVSDPALFLDDDGKLYLYSGSSNDLPIMGVELDPAKNFAPVGRPKALITLDPLRHGWEARDPHATDEQIRNAAGASFLEGAWMTKHKGTYYLQYAAPGTEEKGYADGVYISDRPLGEFRYADYSPFSYRPTGFAPSAGHGSLFQDDAGRFWHATTHFVGTGFKFDRRVGIHPAGFLPDGDAPDQLACNTYLGDYPQLAPGGAADPLAGNLAGWMLLSLNKPASASSTLDDGHDPAKAFDENIGTSWAAATGDPGEWLRVDFGKPCRIDAVQVNFADVDSTTYGRLNDAYRYLLEVSDDGETWTTLVDRKDNRRDAPHEYVQLEHPVIARHARLTNLHTPGGAVFSVSGLRFFGSGLGRAPQQVAGVKSARQTNRRLMNVSWDKAPGADFYVVRYGIKPDRLTLNWQVYDGESVTIPGLNTDSDYFVAVDAVNDTAITRGGPALPAATP